MQNLILKISKNDEVNSTFIDNLEILLRDFIIEYMRKKPSDLVLFASNYFENILKTSMWDKLIKKVIETRSSTVSSGYEKPSRRVGIIGEKFDMSDINLSLKPTLRKSESVIHDIKEAAKKVSLFNGLNDEELDKIIDAMVEKTTKHGEIILEEGEDGDFFYIISKGIFETYVTKNKEPVNLRSYHGEGFFGEIALMYNLPRSATIVSRTDGILWALDRHKFKEIILVKAFKRREQYHNILRRVELFKNLSDYEICIVADSIVERKYAKNQCIIKQDECAKEMFIIESGEVVVRRSENGVEKDLICLGKGEYFGELAMLTKRNRQASVYTLRETVVIIIDTEGFERLLGPCLEIMQRKIQTYDETITKVFGISTSSFSVN